MNSTQLRSALIVVSFAAVMAGSELAETKQPIPAEAITAPRAIALGQVEAPKVRVRTFTYKRVGTLDIKADVYRADDDLRQPVVVWIHGGALISGHRASLSDRIQKMMLEAGYAIVSIDYRLAPESKLSAIIEDVEDAFAWIRQDGPSLFHADTSRLAVMGSSAGGYLTLTADFRVNPRPAVLVSIVGYGDLVGDWYSRPSPHPRHHTTKLTPEEARKQVSGPAIADSRDRQGDGGKFYQFCRQHGIWPKEVSGWDPHTEVEKFIPYMPVRNVTKDFPPTLLIHGTQDTDVPYENAVLMADQLRRHGVEHELFTISGAEHGLDGGDPKRVETAYHTVLEFINRHMKRNTASPGK